MLKVKDSVRPRILVIAAAVINAANEIGIKEDILITSGNDGQHMDHSLHYQYLALDFRTKTLDRVLLDFLMTKVEERLGPKYQVILEHRDQLNEHLHIEYDPSKK